MRSNRRTGGLALAASLALAAGAVTVVMPASAETTDTPPEYVDAGLLSFSAATGSLSFTEPNASSPTKTQNLGAPGTNCIIPTSGDLLAFRGWTGTETNVKNVGWKGSTIGVNEKVAPLCNLVDTVSRSGAETLELTLAPGLDNFAGRPLLAKSATMNVAMGVKTLYTWNQAGSVRATAYLGEDQVGEPVTVTNGLGGCPSTSGATCALTIAPGNFDSLQLTAVKGAIGLQGATVDLVSEVDAVLKCTVGSVVGDGRTSVTFRGGECGSFGVTLESTDNTVKFLKPANVGAGSQFVVDTDWSINIPAEGAQVPATQVDFKNTDAQENDITIGWCQGATYSSGTLTGIDPSSIVDLDGDLAGDQYACVGTQAAQAEGTQLKVQEQIYLVGDVIMRKP